MLRNKQVYTFLYAIEGIGAIFVGVFLTVYLAGLRDVPRTVVYHSEPVFRMALSILGASLIALALTALIIAFVMQRKNEVHTNIVSAIDKKIPDL